MSFLLDFLNNLFKSFSSFFIIYWINKHYKCEWGENMYKYIQLRGIRLLSVIGSIFILYFIFKYTMIYFYPFLIALLFSFVLHPFVTYLEDRLKFPRIFATIFTVCLGFILISGLTLIIITEVIEGTTYLAVRIPAHFQAFVSQFEFFLTNKVTPIYEQLSLLFKSLNSSQQSTIQENIQLFTSQLATSGTQFLKNILLKIPAILSMIPYSVTMMIFVVIGTVLITNDWKILKNLASRFIPKQLKEMSNHLVIHFEKSLFGYIKAQCILIAISAFITLVGLLFLDMNHAFTITLIIAFVDLLPLVGTGVIFIPWIGYLFFSGYYSLTIGLTFIYMAIIFLRQILEPKILSVNIGVSPLIALLTLFISIQWWGVTGIFITPLILVVINTCYRAGVFKSIWYYVKG